MNYEVFRKCEYCGNVYIADKRNLKRGWGLCCSKSCAASKREYEKKNPIEIQDYVINDDNWTDHTEYFIDDNDFECTNGNSYGIHEYRAGCPQDCSSCDYWQPTETSLLKANNKLKKGQDESKNQLRFKRAYLSGGNRQRATSILYRRSETTILCGQITTPKRFECKETRINGG